MTVHSLKARKWGHICRTASLLHYSLLPLLESFWTLTLVDLKRLGHSHMWLGNTSNRKSLLLGDRSRGQEAAGWCVKWPGERCRPGLPNPEATYPCMLGRLFLPGGVWPHSSPVLESSREDSGPTRGPGIPGCLPSPGGKLQSLLTPNSCSKLQQSPHSPISYKEPQDPGDLWH